jgi:hypothetical protein
MDELVLVALELRLNVSIDLGHLDVNGKFASLVLICGPSTASVERHWVYSHDDELRIS